MAALNQVDIEGLWRLYTTGDPGFITFVALVIEDVTDRIARAKGLG